MSDLTHDDVKGLLAAYALEILAEDEAQAVARHLPGCAECRAELATYSQVTDDLALAAPNAAPDPAAKRRLMARIQTQPRVVPAEAGPGMWQTIASALRGWRPVAVALAVLVIISLVLWWGQGRSPDVPTGQRIELTATDAAPEANGVIEIGTGARQGTLTVEGLPALDADRQYQLWLIKDGERVSGGVFSVSERGEASITIAAPEPIDGYAAYGITVEPFGGSPGPTGERVLGYNL